MPLRGTWLGTPPITDRELLEAFDNGSGHVVTTDSLDDDSDGPPRNDEDPAFAGPSG
jgi:hypothetical protein